MLLTNVDTIVPFEAGRRIADIVLADGLAPPVAAMPDDQQAVVAGLYGEPQSGEILRIGVAGGLTVTTNSATFPLRPVGDGWHEPQNPVWDMRLKFDPGGDAIEAVDCGRPTVYRRLPPFRLVPADLARYVGTYRNGDLGADYIVEPDRDGVLQLQMHGELGRNEARLEPVAADTFFAHARRPDWGPSQPTIRFQRDRGGGVQGLSVTTDRAKGLRFERQEGGVR